MATNLALERVQLLRERIAVVEGIVADVTCSIINAVSVGLVIEIVVAINLEAIVIAAVDAVVVEFQ